MKKLIRILLPVIALLLALGFSMQVSAAQTQEITIEPIYVQQINPVYQEFLQAESYTSPVFYDGPITYYESIEDAAKVLREKMEDREATISIGFKTKDNPNEVPLSKMIIDSALEHTGNPTQGDYLLWQYKRYGCHTAGSYYPSTGIYELKLTYTLEYYTTNAQEELMDRRVDELLDELNVYKANDYVKVCTIYDYMCENIVYDYDGLAAQNSNLIYTAYAALINKTSVCQGYANLFYRLALELGVDCRIITGMGNGGPHAWNIVKLNGKYYDLDATWDATRRQAKLDYQFFLCSDDAFGDHQRDTAYLTAEFYAQYPMGNTNYSYTEPEFVPGEFDGEIGVTDSDALYLLRHNLFPESFPVDAAVDKDINSDGFFSDADAIYLLRFTLFPDTYPLYPGK